MEGVGPGWVLGEAAFFSQSELCRETRAFGGARALPGGFRVENSKWTGWVDLRKLALPAVIGPSVCCCLCTESQAARAAARRPILQWEELSNFIRL